MKSQYVLYPLLELVKVVVQQSLVLTKVFPQKAHQCQVLVNLRVSGAEWTTWGGAGMSGAGGGAEWATWGVGAGLSGGWG